MSDLLVRLAGVRRWAGLLASTLLGLALAGSALFILQRPPTALAKPSEAPASLSYPGCGATIQISLGGKYDELHGAPIETRAYVKSLSDGRLVIFGAGELRVFDSVGNYLRRVAGPGEGPGDLPVGSPLITSEMLGDSVAILNHRGRLSVFDPTMNL